MPFTTEFYDQIKDRVKLAELIKSFISKASTQHIKFKVERIQSYPSDSALCIKFYICIMIDEHWFDIYDRFHKDKIIGCCYQPYFIDEFYPHIEKITEYVFKTKGEWNNNRMAITIDLKGIDHNLLLSLEKEYEKKKQF
jgi:hypothetical protein